jgi:hypothetical protein
MLMLMLMATSLRTDKFLMNLSPFAEAGDYQPFGQSKSLPIEESL